MSPNSYPPNGKLPRLEQMLEHGSKRHPTKTAVTYLDDGEYKHISYDQLNTKAHRLATCLECRLQVFPGSTLVGIFLARSVGQIVAILATLIAGAAYVPLALDLTDSRFHAILVQTRARVIITDSEQQAHLNDMLKKAGRDDIVTINITEADKFQLKHISSSTSLTAASPAYVLFSSGTTGTPKGIVTPHSAVRAYCEGANKVYQANNADKWVQAASYTFDSSIDEIFCPLMIGAGIVIQPNGALANFMSYLKFLDDSGATIVTMTTALWHRLASYLIQHKRPLPPKIRLVSVGGEAGMTSVLKEWRATFGDYPRFLNGYGPTETTVCATYWEGQEDVATPVIPIGRPLPDYKCYVLDPLTETPVESGKEGVLFISGPGLAIGYLNDPTLTEQRFVPNPWAESMECLRMYNTGDLVRVDENGVFHFHGRADLQVKVGVKFVENEAVMVNMLKIRGFRVELEAVEACLLTHSRVKAVAVVASTEQQSQTINAYIVELPSDEESLCAEDLIDHCRKTLAYYEIPAHFYQVQNLPFTRSGKVDRQALKSVPAKQFHFRKGPVINSNLGEVNPILLDLWCQCLENVSPAVLSAQSNFIHMGGHSLTLITLAAKIHLAVKVKVSVIELLQNPMLSQMSALLDQRVLAVKSRDSLSACMPSSHENDHALGGTYPLSSAQARLYVVQQNSPDSPFFNDGLAIQITGTISYDHMYSALMTIVRRHRILRIKLTQDTSAHVSQEVMPFDESLFSEMFSHEHLERPAAEQRAREIFLRPFDLFNSLLISISILSSGNTEHILVVCAHHIIWDGFSDRVFLDELVALYQGKKISPPSSYFHCFSSPQAKPDANHLSSLISYLDSVPQLLELPIDFVRPNTQTYSHGCSTRFSLDPRAVSSLVDRLGSTPFSCLMTAFALTLHLCAAGQEDFMIGVPFANRLSIEAGNAIGFFVNMLPLRVKFANIGTLDELHAMIRQDLLFLAEVQDVPVDSLVDALGMNRLISSNSLLQTVLNFTDAPEGNLDARAKFSRFPVSNGAAHTDLTCFVELGKDGTLLGELEYDSEIFAHESMDSLAHAFVHIVDTWSTQPSQAIDQIVFPERSTHIPLIRELDPADSSLGAFIASSANRYSKRQAVYDDTTGMSYTYDQLFSMSQCIQERLRQFQCPGGVVLMLLERNIDVIAAQIGVSLAGLAWVPCDVAQPLLRLHDIILDSNPVCIIGHQRVLRLLGASESDFPAPIVLVDEIYDDLTCVNTHGSVVADAAGKRAYMIYTSGSTGRPKGIAIGHASIIRWIREIMTWAESGTSYNCIATCNVAWDMLLIHLYPTLATGGCVKLPKINGDKDGEYLSALMKKNPAVNFFCSTSSALRMWLDQTKAQSGSFFPDGMSHIILGGEEITPKFAQRALTQASGSPLVQVLHVYGPTEGTVFNSFGVLRHSDLKNLTQYRRLPIDRVFSHASMTVVNAAGHQLPPGFVGEIIIWGLCLMLEYNNLPELNAKQFLVKDGVRGWRSGDLGRQLPSGKFEILGRMGSMCKVKGGFRVDLSEIEMQIRSYPGVDECCVSLASVANETGEVDDCQIVAHVVLKGYAEQEDQKSRYCKQNVSQQVLTGLYRHLSHRIPAYMVPDYVVPIGMFPLTSSTKVDKQKLTKASPSDRFVITTSSTEWTAEDEAHRTTVEAIIKIFTTVLSIDKKLSPKDNFYNCGGHSLLATRVTSLIRCELEVPLPFTAIITNPTASELAEFVHKLKLQSARSVRLPPNIIPLQPADFILRPKAFLFAFPFIGGDLDMLPRVVNQLDNATLGLATYGICWEPGRNLNTLEKIATAYAESISALAGSTPCFLLGWCFGGMIASQVALNLPKATTYLMVIDVLHLSEMWRFKMDEADYAKAFAEYLCKVWFGPNLQSANKAGILHAVQDAKLDWHNITALVSLARKHVTLPSWVTDSDLEQRLLPLADGHDIMTGIYGHHCCSPAEALEIEERVVLNLQATDGLNIVFDTEVGLGWSHYEVIDTNHDIIGYLPIASARMLSVLRKILL